jgi:ABC-2 type transport system permease protein
MTLFGLNWRRMRGVYRRLLLELINNKSELFEIFAWALLDLLAWGLLASFIERGDVQLPLPIAFLIGSALLWAVMFRFQIGSSFSFLYEAWSGNALAVLASPVTPLEYFLGGVAFSLVVTAVQLGVMAAVAWIGFGFTLGALGPAIVPFFAILALFGLALSLVVVGLIFRYGHGANMLAWTLSGLLQPLSAVYYPVAILPGWAQTAAQILPTTHAFEGMRAVLAGQPLQLSRLGFALALDVGYLALGAWYAGSGLKVLRHKGFATRYAN